MQKKKNWFTAGKDVVGSHHLLFAWEITRNDGLPQEKSYFALWAMINYAWHVWG